MGPRHFYTNAKGVDRARLENLIPPTSWCLAQDEGCGGQGLYEPTRCTSCNDAVIDSAFALAWSEIYAHQEELLTEANDLGAGATRRVQRDLRKSREVLSDLGVTLDGDTDGYKANINE
jgi:hypothetical protein